MGFTDKLTARDSIWWPDSFPAATRIKMTVNGRISRKYNPDIWPSLNLAGKPYFYIDADGEFQSGSCYGQIATNFRIASPAIAMNLNGCRTGTTNSPNYAPQDAATEHTTIGVAKGYGYVRRLSFVQPTYPSTQYCGVWPTARCVWANPGSQQVTIEPTATLLTLTATPDSILSGDQVLFQPAVPASWTYSVKTWIWVPDDSDTFVFLPPPIAMRAPESSMSGIVNSPFSSGPAIPSPMTSAFKASNPRSKFQGGFGGANGPGAAAVVLDPRTVYCPTTGSNCQIPIYQSGTMYVRALVGTGSSAVLEQASAHVRVANPTLHAICDATPTPTERIVNDVACTAELSDKTLPFTIIKRRAVTADTVIEENPALLIAAGESDLWEGGRAVQTTVTFEATVNILGRPLTITSNPAVFLVTPRTWVEPTIPVVAPIKWISKATSDSAARKTLPDSSVPQPFPGFAFSTSPNGSDRVLPGGAAVHNFGGPQATLGRVSAGPNKDYVYVTQMPSYNVGEVSVLTSLKEGEPFFLRQTSPNKLPGDKNLPPQYTQYCDSAAMVAWRQHVYEHEGAAQGSTPSHHSASRAYILAHPLAPYFESMVYYRQGSLAADHTFEQRYTTNYQIPMKATTNHTNAGGTVPLVPAIPCKLRQ